MGRKAACVGVRCKESRPDRQRRETPVSEAHRCIHPVAGRGDVTSGEVPPRSRDHQMIFELPDDPSYRAPHSRCPGAPQRREVIQIQEIFFHSFLFPLCIQMAESSAHTGYLVCSQCSIHPLADLEASSSHSPAVRAAWPYWTRHLDHPARLLACRFSKPLLE